MSMISELVDRLRTEAKSMGTYGTDYMATLLMRSADTIEMLSEKAREPKQEWIPCSERLPSEYSDEKRILVTTDVDELGVIIMPIYDVESWYRKGYISAWMPLPKPWEGEKDV